MLYQERDFVAIFQRMWASLSQEVVALQTLVAVRMSHLIRQRHVFQTTNAMVLSFGSPLAFD